MEDTPGNRGSRLFTAVDELDEAARALGWSIEYRQLGRGSFSAELASSECAGLHLAWERFDNHLHIPTGPPEGLVGVFLPDTSAGRVDASGRPLAEGDLVVFPPRSELEFVTRGEVRNATVFLTEAEFRTAARALAPSRRASLTGSATILRGDPRSFAAIRSRIARVHQAGRPDPEAASQLLARIVLWMADAWSMTDAVELADGAAARVARRVQSYIEDRFRGPIRMADLCAHVGHGLRTVQRAFASYFQLSPTGYITARRLNEARRALVATDPASGTVTGIATESGFSHLGRFSVTYRAYFGESPSETLAAR